MDIDECVKEAEKLLETNNEKDTLRAIGYVLLSMIKTEQEKRKQQKDPIVPQKEVAQKSVPKKGIFVLEEKEEEDSLLNGSVVVF